MSRFVPNPNFDSMDVPAVKAWVLKNAASALSSYRTDPLEYDDPNYRFDRHVDEPTIRDPGMTHFRQIRNGVKLISEAPSAGYLEYGNAPDGSGRHGVVIRPKNSKRLKIKLLMAENGSMFLKVPYVKSYKATHRLRNSIIRAFGFEP